MEQIKQQEQYVIEGANIEYREMKVNLDDIFRLWYENGKLVMLGYADYKINNFQILKRDDSIIIPKG